jgi:hypothetical protein
MVVAGGRGQVSLSFSLAWWIVRSSRLYIPVDRLPRVYIKQDSGIQLAAGNERIVGPYYFHSVYLRLIGPVLKNKVRPVIFTRCGTGPTKRAWPISKIFLTTLDWMTWILRSTHFPVNIYESIFAPLCLFLRVPYRGSVPPLLPQLLHHRWPLPPPSPLAAPTAEASSPPSGQPSPRPPLSRGIATAPDNPHH